MQIDLRYDSSTLGAPSGFVTDMNYAASLLDSLLTDNITIAIDVSWDYQNPSAVLGEAGPNLSQYDYGSVVAALSAHASAEIGPYASIAHQAVTELPATDPSSTGQIWVADAQAEALGLFTSSTIDTAGSATFGTGGAALNFSTTDLTISNEVSFLGVALHELTHALGRMSFADASASGFGGLDFTIMDLYRYTSPGHLQTNANFNNQTAPASYFSLNGGATTLAAFSTTSDYSDWASSVSNDSFDAFAVADKANPITAVDKQLLSAIGFDVACFCPGTLIETAHGPRAIEDLRIGDELVTAQHGTQRVKWIGESRYDGRFLGANPLMLPVTFAAGALAEGLPARDLTVSPGHGMYLGGALVPAWRLVNGLTITQAPRSDEVRYLHIEFEQHDLISAEGTWSESFLNEVPRSWFHNGADYAALYPGDDTPRAPCAPRLENGLALEALRHALNARAGLAMAPEGTGALHGFVEACDGTNLSGWAVCADSPDVPVMLLVLAGGEIITRLPANRYRADVRAAGYGKGCCGFTLTLPAHALGQVIAVRRAVDGAELGPSGCPPAQIAA
jgi:hypothetical protein